MRVNLNKQGDRCLQFYRGIYGGCHWLPFIYLTKSYSECGWLLWVLTYSDNSDTRHL